MVKSLAVLTAQQLTMMKAPILTMVAVLSLRQLSPEAEIEKARNHQAVHSAGYY